MEGNNQHSPLRLAAIRIGGVVVGAGLFLPSLSTAMSGSGDIALSLLSMSAGAVVTGVSCIAPELIADCYATMLRFPRAVMKSLDYEARRRQHQEEAREARDQAVAHGLVEDMRRAGRTIEEQVIEIGNRVNAGELDREVARRAADIADPDSATDSEEGERRPTTRTETRAGAAANATLRQR